MSLDRIDIGLKLVAERDAAKAEIAKLTPRQQEVVGYVTKGFHAREIAPLLGCGLTTVETHRRRALEALGTDFRGLIVLGTKAGLA